MEKFSGIKDFLDKIRMSLIDEEKNKNLVYLSVYTILGVVALVMTVMNIFTQKGWLTVATGVFAGLCLFNITLIVLGDKKSAKFSAFLFAVEILALFTFFVISGNPEGFSAIWICLLPSLGMFCFGRKSASFMCGVMFIVLVVLLWTPFGNGLLMYDYTESFKMRFPVLFAAFFVLGLFLESIRVFTYDEMRRMQKLYKELSVRDQLTGALNRQGMYTAIETGTEFQHFEKIGAVMLDLDDFKTVNDRFGHAIGDAVLKEFSYLISTNLNSVVCRWGGEEFVAIYVGDAVTPEKLDWLRNLIENHVFESHGTHVNITTSIGVCEAADFDIKDIDRLIEKADVALYEAKDSGKNMVVYSKETL